MKYSRLMAFVLMLSLFISGASAESILPILTPAPTAAPTPTPASTPASAPSYGMMANVAADEVTQNAQGGTVVTYRNVSADGFNSFGVYLGQRGFSVAGTETQGEQTAYALTNGQTDFVMFYDVAQQTMTFVYPQGIEYEQPAFPGYTQIPFNEEIKIPGLGIFTFHDFVLNGQGKRDYYYTTTSKHDYSKEMNSWLSFTFFNTSTTEIFYGYYKFEKRSDLFTTMLVYQNADAEYQYDSKMLGAFKQDTKQLAYEKNQFGFECYHENKFCAPLSEMEYATVFELPSYLRSSSDGTIAIKLDFKTGEKYVLVARENGVDLNIDASQLEK